MVNPYLREKEWSGPAWYSYKKDKDGFPNRWTLEFFWVLDIGNKSATDWDEDDLVPDYQKIWKMMPKTKTSWYRGNIHSHNTMESFFSGTDDDLLLEMAKDNDFFFPSIICSDSKTPWAFSVAYKDQYKVTQIMEGRVREELPSVNTEWLKATNAFIKQDIEDNKVSVVGTQSSMWEKHHTANGNTHWRYNGKTGYNEAFNANIRQDNAIVTHGQGGVLVEDNEDPTIVDKWAEVLHLFETGQMSEEDFTAECKKMRVYADGVPQEDADTKNYNKSYSGGLI